MTEDNNPNSILVDLHGRLIIPPELASLYAIKPGDEIGIYKTPDGLSLRLPSRLNKLYIEPTNQCNLDCRTCVRNYWDEPMGRMSDAVFARIVEGLRTFSPPPGVFFGGIGEPLSHPRIVQMVAAVKALGARVELITNATLLTADISRQLVQTGLDRLWVSLDGATPESYADIRLGAALPQVLKNLGHFQEAVFNERGMIDCCTGGARAATELGIAFVAMKRNIADLPAVIRTGQHFGAGNFMVSNVIPYSKTMISETLYHRGLIDNGYFKQLSLPRMDMDELTFKPLFQAVKMVNGNMAGIYAENLKNRCPFIAGGSGAVRWDGGLSPCLPLLHRHTTYSGFLPYEERLSERWIIGNLMEHSLADLWNMPEHLSFRDRVQDFDFAECTICGSCDLAEKNEEDCIGNTFPTCGGCLWAQGVVQCP
jgi:MoaA/NifB/PqqE/SkfB family radical SAM enzyme